MSSHEQYQDPEPFPPYKPVRLVFCLACLAVFAVAMWVIGNLWGLN